MEEKKLERGGVDDLAANDAHGADLKEMRGAAEVRGLRVDNDDGTIERHERWWQSRLARRQCGGRGEGGDSSGPALISQYADLPLARAG